MQTINTAAAAKCDCPQCGGYPELDESGRPYTCYLCCDSGYVDAAIVVAWDRDAQDAIEYRSLRPVVGGKHLVARYDGETGEGWDEERPLLPAALFRRAARVVVLSSGADDIAF